MFKLKIISGTGGEDANVFAGELATIISKTTGAVAKNGVFCL